MAVAITIIVAIIFIALYADKIQDCKQLERDNKWLREQRERSPEHVSAENADNRPVDEDAIMEALRYNGYVPTKENGYIRFMIQGNRYFVRTDKLPYFMLDKPYTINRENYDMALLKAASIRVTESIFIGKTVIEDDGETLRFMADAYEPTYGHLRDSIGSYLTIIHDMQGRLGEVYEDMCKKRENQKELESYGLTMGQDTSGQNKVLS